MHWINYLLLVILSLSQPLYAASVPTTSSAAPKVENQEKDRLDLASGAVVLSRSSEYDTSTWSALSLLDSTNKTGWCSKDRAPFPHRFVIELDQNTLLKSIVFDNTTAQEASYPGISARKVEVQVSMTSPTEGFSSVLQVEAKKGARSEFPFPTNTKARWLKIIIHSNWGNPQYTELMELEAYGSVIAGTSARPPLAGIYKTNYNLMLFEQTGNQVRGCYDWDGGSLSGTTNGRVVQFEWRENEGTEVGTAIMVLSAKGDKINGLWYEGGRLKGIWVGDRAQPGQKPKCMVDAKSAIAKALTESGRTITYGIQFDVNSDRIKKESEQVLNEVLAFLKASPQVGLIIEGHTDATASDEYNQDLSQRRAQTVVKWLVNKGITSSRLEAKGYGEKKPVADNNTLQGRSLNRRVELAVRK